MNPDLLLLIIGAGMILPALFTWLGASLDGHEDGILGFLAVCTFVAAVVGGVFALIAVVSGFVAGVS